MHYKEAKGILSAQNGMNMFRGCTHGCIYCDSRSKVYQMNHEFTDIEVKINAPELLEKALMSKRKKCMIGTGSMTDPYVHEEIKLEMTRTLLKIIAKYKFGATIITKSNRILRDLDLIKQINQDSKFVVQMTLTTYDEALCKIVEPRVSTTKERYEVLKMMRDEGIPTVVWISPLLPLINDTLENVAGILKYCVDAQVKGIIWFGAGLTLREGNREYYYQKLDQHFPGLKETYIKKYGNQYELHSDHHDEINRMVHETCEKHGIMHDINQVFEYLHTYEEKKLFKQISLFD
ncbi:MAG: radical SAM protein [Firmicutes bacterium]|nr:radical SAM protein [Bacillota bacterium]